MTVTDILAVAAGFIILGWCAGLVTYHLNLSWFLAHVWKPEATSLEMERAITRLKKRMERQDLRERLKGRVGSQKGRHLPGAKGTRSAVAEVLEERGRVS